MRDHRGVLRLAGRDSWPWLSSLLVMTCCVLLVAGRIKDLWLSSIAGIDVTLLAGFCFASLSLLTLLVHSGARVQNVSVQLILGTVFLYFMMGFAQGLRAIAAFASAYPAEKLLLLTIPGLMFFGGFLIFYVYGNQTRRFAWVYLIVAAPLLFAWVASGSFAGALVGVGEIRDDMYLGYGRFLATGLLIAVYLLLTSKGLLGIGIGGGLAMVFGTMALVNPARSALLGLVVVGLIVFLGWVVRKIQRANRKISFRRGFRAIGILGLLSIGAFVAFTIVERSAVPMRAIERAVLLLEEDPGRSAAQRLELYERGWQMFGEHPLIGWGLGGFQVMTEGRNRHPHNLLLELGVEFGTVGLVGFLLIMTIIAVSWTKVWQVYPAEGVLVLSLWLLMLAISMVTGDMNDNREIFLFGGVIAGLAAHAQRRELVRARAAMTAAGT